MDLADFHAQLKLRDTERKASAAVARTEMQAKLAALGVTKVDATYDAGGDSGNIEDVTFTPAIEDFPQDLDTELRDILWGIVYCLHPGFENNDGGDGEISWDVEADKMNIEHRERFTDYTPYSYEDV